MDSDMYAEQSLIIDQLYNRLESLWMLHPELRAEMLQLERRYPITGFHILKHLDREDLPERFSLKELRVSETPRGVFMWKRI